MSYIKRRVMEVDKDGEIIRGDELINIDVKEIYVGEGVK